MNSTDRKKILITGATGFIGQHLLEEFEGADWEITILSRRKAPQIRSSLKLNIVQGDIGEYESVLTASKEKDIIINLAAEIRVPHLIYRTNIGGTVNILKAAEQNSVKKIIHLSSVGVVGMQYSSEEREVNELSLCKPKNDYEKSKLESERMMQEAGKKGDIEIVILRPTNVFGEFHPDNILLGLIQHCAKKNKIYFRRNAIVNYLYVKDLSGAIKFFASNNSDGILYNVGKPGKLENILTIIANEFEFPVNKKYLSQIFFQLGNLLPGKFSVKSRALSNKVSYTSEKLNSVFQYPFGTDIGLKKLVQHYRQEGKLK